MGRIPKEQYNAKLAELAAKSAELDQAKKECAANLEALNKKIADESANSQAKISSLETQNSQMLKDMESSKSDLQKRLAELTREKQQAEKEKLQTEKEKQQAELAKQAAEQEKQEAEKMRIQAEKEKAAEVDRLKSTYDNLVSDMKKEIEQGSIQITQLQNKLSVNLVDKILFNSGEWEVNEQGRQVLAKVANILKKIQDKQIRIEGHTDNKPIGGALKDKFPTNWELSTARATNVARYLQEVGGIDPKILYAAGYAEFRPIADNSQLEGRSKNRRIEIALVPLEGAAEPQAASKPPAKP